MHPESEKQAPAWAIVEIMGHRVIAGRISEVSRFGASFCRVEVDLPDGTIAAQEYSGSAIFCITPSDEATVRRRQASGTYAGPLAIDPPRSEALKLTASEPHRYRVVQRAEDYQAETEDAWRESVVCEGAACSKRALFPANAGWTRGEHDGVPLWFCPDCSDRHRPTTTNAPPMAIDTPAAVCPECGQPLGLLADCFNFGACSRADAPPDVPF
mgnify:CR=1 FL=1